VNCNWLDQDSRGAERGCSQIQKEKPARKSLPTSTVRTSVGTNPSLANSIANMAQVRSLAEVIRQPLGDEIERLRPNEPEECIETSPSASHVQFWQGPVYFLTRDVIGLCTVAGCNSRAAQRVASSSTNMPTPLVAWTSWTLQRKLTEEDAVTREKQQIAAFARSNPQALRKTPRDEFLR